MINTSKALHAEWIAPSFVFACLLLAATTRGRAQDAADTAASAVAVDVASSSSSLPEAPAPEILSSSIHAVFEGESGFQITQRSTATTPPMAGPYTKYILPGQPVPRLNIGDKVVLGVRDAFGPLSAVGWVVSAGYAQAVDGTPNYGQTGKGFAQRLGAAAARASSEGIFSDSVLAPILHEDPRYYMLGRQHGFFPRLVYAGTRVLITRTDGGRHTPNFSLLGGNLAGSALTQAYYPPINRGISEVLLTFGGSVGGSALGFVVSEFLADTLHGLHITK